jgi:hypothetical protein
VRARPLRIRVGVPVLNIEAPAELVVEGNERDYHCPDAPMPAVTTCEAVRAKYWVGVLRVRKSAKLRHCRARSLSDHDDPEWDQTILNRDLPAAILGEL